MLTRLTHAGVTFALTVAAYQAYVLMLVPFVEPAGAAGPVIQAISLEELRKPPAALERYRPLLAAYFPADHWCFQTPPKIVENGQAMVVFDDYTQSESGELRVPRVAMIFFPGTRDRSGDPPRDAIILEPAGGATLQMNQQVGKRFGSMGRMQYGQLLGAVTVRSDMKEPGPQDDLLIETKDLYMNEEFLRTAEPVTLRLGQHRGRGRELVIKFYKSDSTSSSGGNVFGKLDSLEVTHEVAALVQPGSVTMFGKQTAGGGVAPPEAPAGATKKLSDAPAQITCTGPFRIDFANHVATFNDAVRLTQLQSDGTLDELTAPRDLTLYFAEVRHWGGEGASTPTPIASSPKLEPATVEARGFPDALIDLQAPSQGAAARGERLRIELISRQVTLEGGDEVSLNYHGTEVHAPMVRYELPPKDSHGRLGLMAALGGGGWLRAAADPKRPSEQLFVRWTQSMQMVRRAGQPVLVLDGRPRVDMPGMGTLWADQLELYLRERAEGAAPPLPQASSVLPATISAERIVATGSVGIESAEVNCRVSELDLELHDPATAPAVASLPGAAPTAAAGAARTADPRALLDRSGGTGPRRTYFITGRTLEIDAVVQDRRPQVSSIRVDGGVTFEESTTGAAGEAPLRIRAEHLIVTDASSPQAKIEIRGADAAGGLPAGE
ncbi:MAG TPA: hypothetical protein VEQ85_06450, partial [Lacipirellulaceae bacterium]|nr:hypothetical protein [Lacipirellulaceae bacterium]